MADRVLQEEPPSPNYRQVGWHCIYHEQTGGSCHNPLDCDLVPMWALAVEPAKRLLREVERRNVL